MPQLWLRQEEIRVTCAPHPQLPGGREGGYAPTGVVEAYCHHAVCMPCQLIGAQGAGCGLKALLAHLWEGIGQ